MVDTYYSNNDDTEFEVLEDFHKEILSESPIELQPLTKNSQLQYRYSEKESVFYQLKDFNEISYVLKKYENRLKNEEINEILKELYPVPESEQIIEDNFQGLVESQESVGEELTSDGFQLISENYLLKEFSQSQNQVSIQKDAPLVDEELEIEKDDQNIMAYLKLLQFLKYAGATLEKVMLDHPDLKEKLLKYSKKCLKIVRKKEKDKNSNFSGIKIYFQQLKKDYDEWFMSILDTFEGLEQLIQRLELLQQKNQQSIEESIQNDYKLKWGMYSSTIIGVLGAPITGYSLTLTLLGGSLQIQRYRLSTFHKKIDLFYDINSQLLEMLYLKEAHLRKIIDSQLVKIKLNIDIVVNQTNRVNAFNLSEIKRALKQIEASDQSRNSKHPKKNLGRQSRASTNESIQPIAHETQSLNQ